MCSFPYDCLMGFVTEIEVYTERRLIYWKPLVHIRIARRKNLFQLKAVLLMMIGALVRYPVLLNPPPGWQWSVA